MSRRPRGSGLDRANGTGQRTPAGGATAMSPTPASTPAPEPRVRMGGATLPGPRPVRRRVTSGVLTQLAGAVAVSRARTDRPVHARTSAAPAADVPLPAPSPSLPLDPAAFAALAPSEHDAYEFAKLLRAGVPALDAYCYVRGVSEGADVAVPLWLRSRLVVDALAALNGGTWPSLEPDRRLDVALDKHYAELAHYIYTHDYESADGKEMRKLDTARDALERLRTGRLEQNSPFMRFLATLLKPSAQVPSLAGAQAIAQGERPALLGYVELEPAVEGEVTAAVEEA